MRGYQAQQTQSINRNADLQQQSVNNIMAAHGLSTSPAAGTAGAGVESQRFGSITNLNEGLPLLQNTLNLQNLGAAGQFAATIPHGQTTTGTGTSFSNEIGTQGTTSTGTSTGTSTSLGTGTQSGNAQSSSLGSAGGGVGGALGGFAALLAALAKQTDLSKIFKPGNNTSNPGNLPPVISIPNTSGPGTGYPNDGGWGL
jgi:hypothetical protein